MNGEGTLPAFFGGSGTVWVWERQKKGPVSGITDPLSSKRAP